MTWKIFTFIMIAEICSASTHTFFKHGVNGIDMEHLSGVKNYLRFLRQVLASPQIWMGLVVVCSGMAVWLLVLAEAELSMAFPLDSIQYVIILFSSYLFLGERINRDRIIGTVFIIAGIVLVALK